MVDVSCDGMFPFEFTKFYFQPHTYGFWRPIEVEIGFIEDYIQRSLIETDDLIIG
jgi:hypothetical protein